MKQERTGEQEKRRSKEVKEDRRTSKKSRRQKSMKKMSGLVKKLGWCGMRKGLPWEEEENHQPLPKGHVRVYVGKEDVLSKFELEANYLNHPLFEDLIQLSVDEFGYSYSGALRIACDVPLFLYLVDLLKSSNPSAHYLQLHDLFSQFDGGKHIPIPAKTPN